MSQKLKKGLYTDIDYLLSFVNDNLDKYEVVSIGSTHAKYGLQYYLIYRDKPLQNTIFVSGSCEGEVCTICSQPATNKIGEEILHDDPFPNRHNLTAYVCSYHFKELFISQENTDKFCRLCNRITGPDRHEGCDHFENPLCAWNINPKYKSDTE